VINRKCGSCTKCCEGNLSGEAFGLKFYQGKPCHFVAIGKGCSVYSKRPADPCVSYKCGWLTNPEIPEWMKPNEIDAIVDEREIEGITYLNLREAGSPMQARILSWYFQYILATGKNAVWQVEGGLNWVGSLEFNSSMELENQKGVHRGY
jgi:hypothetical protein